MKQHSNATRIGAILMVGTLLAPPAMAEVSLVRDGRPRAVVVTADEPTPTARYAAGELVRHVEKATGARVAIVGESDAPADVPTRVYVGATAAGRRRGIDTVDLPREAFLLRSMDGDLFIAGNCKTSSSRSGTAKASCGWVRSTGRAGASATIATRGTARRRKPCLGSPGWCTRPTPGPRTFSPALPPTATPASGK